MNPLKPALRRINKLLTAALFVSITLSAMGQTVLRPQTMPKIAQVDPRYVSYNVEAIEITGGRFFSDTVAPIPPDPPQTGCAKEHRSTPSTAPNPVPAHPKHERTSPPQAEPPAGRSNSPSPHRPARS